MPGRRNVKIQTGKQFYEKFPAVATKLILRAAMHDFWLFAAYTAVCIIVSLIVYFYLQRRKPKQDKKLSEHIAFTNVDFGTRIFYPFVNPKGVMNLRLLSAEKDAGIPWLDVSKMRYILLFPTDAASC